MPTEDSYDREADDIDEIQAEERRMTLKENERFVVCGSCVKHIRKVEKGSDEPFFEKCAACITSQGEEQ